MAEASCKLFFALQPPAHVAVGLDRFRDEARRRLGLSVAVPPLHRLHVSLTPLGRHDGVPHDLVRRAIAAVSALSAPPFVLAFNRLGSWGRGAGGRPVMLWGDDGVIGAELLHAAVHEALAKAGMARGRPREIVPHLTLWRDAQETPQRFVAPVAWRVREFALLAAVRGEGAHRVLGRWRLAG